MSVEEKAASIIAKVGLWWPLAEEDQLRRAAGAYQDVAKVVRGAAVTGSAGAKLASGGNTGEAFNAFDKHWAQYNGDCTAGLPATASAAEQVAAALKQFAEAVEDSKHKIINLAIEIGATIAVGVAMAFFTFGTTAGAAAARTAMLVARGLAIGAGLTGVAATIVATALVGAAFGAMEGFISSIVAQVGKQVLSDGTGITLSETMSWTAWGAGGGFVLGGGASAVRTGFRAIRTSDNLLASRLRAAGRVADDTVGLPRPPRVEGGPAPTTRPDYDGNPDFRSSTADRQAYRETLPEGEWDHSLNMLGGWRTKDIPNIARIAKEDLVAIRQYGGGNSWEMNLALRSGDPDLLAKQGPAIRAATSGLNQLLPYEGVVRRGLKLSPEQLDDVLKHYTVGDIIEEPAFVGTSTTKPTPGEVEFVINSRTGKSIDGISLSGGENEILFPPGSQFHVIGKSFDGNVWHIYLDDVSGFSR